LTHLQASLSHWAPVPPCQANSPEKAEIQLKYRRYQVTDECVVTDTLDLWKTMMNPHLEIAFGRSPSAHYQRAVSLAQSIPGYRIVGEGRTVIHRITSPAPLRDEANWGKLQRLLCLIAAWRSTSITVNGRPVKCWAFLVQLGQIKACHDRRVRAGTDGSYCSGKNASGDEGNYFGCRHLRGVNKWSHDRHSWTYYGTLSPKRDSFRVDKKAILETLTVQTQGKACRFCPAFDWKRVRGDVKELPSTIKLGDRSAFEVRYSDLDPSKALGIKRKEPPESENGLGTLLQIRVKQPETATERQVPNVRYADVAGQDTALAALRSVVELPLCHGSYFEALGVAPQSGVILYGPPGNGKTLLAKAVATESNAHLEIISGPEILSKWLGQSEANLRQIFTRARELAPSVVLIDELDSLAPRRALLSHQHDVQLLSQLLVLLDGLEGRGRVAVVATTNRLEAIDPALCRPGRFDYHIEVAGPDHEGRLAILRVHLSKLKHRDFRLEDLVLQTDGYSGAELGALCREAGVQAIQRGLAKGVPANRLMVRCQDMQAALKTLQAKRVNLEVR
jgi:ATP-dependent 26S proteasome regulatory subunit